MEKANKHTLFHVDFYYKQPPLKSNVKAAIIWFARKVFNRVGNKKKFSMLGKLIGINQIDTNWVCWLWPQAAQRRNKTEIHSGNHSEKSFFSPDKKETT